jgi:hypothetical protein
MKELLTIDRFEQAEALFEPQRVEVLRQLAEPRSCISWAPSARAPRRTS